MKVFYLIIFLILTGYSANADGIAGGGVLLGFTPAQVFNITDYGAKCDGVTNDNTAINAAFAAAAASSAYQNNNKISITGPSYSSSKGCLINSINGTGFTLGNGSNPRPQVEISNMTLLCTGAGNTCLDFTGSTFIKIHDISIRGNGTAGQIPEICIQVSITTQNTSSAWHMFERVNCNNSFAFTALYNFGSESNQYIGNVWHNSNIANGPIVTLGSITGGTSYTSGTYTSVPLTGGSGSGALATVIVSGGSIISVVLSYEGRDYAPGDSLSAAAANIGGTGSGFAVAVTAAAPFSVVLDGENHWRATSAFVSITAPVETWESLTLLTFIGDNIRVGQTGTANAATVWMGWVSGPRMVNTYMLNSGNGATSACLELFDDGVTKSGVVGPNNGLNFEIGCEGGGTYGIYQAGSNATPTLYYAKLRMSVLSTATAYFGLASNITAINAFNADWSATYPTTVPIFTSAKLWSVVGRVEMASPAQWYSPASFSGQIVLLSTATPPSIGPLDILGFAAGAWSCARQLSHTYTGALCNVHRASDGTNVDLYPDVYGNLDRTAFQAFCANTTCTIATAYDQSGNMNNAAQSIVANQPGLTLKDSSLGRPVIAFGDAGALALQVTSSGTIDSLWTAGGVASIVYNQIGSNTQQDRIFEKSAWRLQYKATASTPIEFSQVASTTSGVWDEPSQQSNGGHVEDVQYSSASLSNVPTIFKDGTQQTLTSTQPVGTITSDSGNNMFIGNNALTTGTRGFNGNIAEAIMWKAVPTSVQMEAIRRNQGAYYGLGSTVN